MDTNWLQQPESVGCLSDEFADGQRGCPGTLFCARCLVAKEDHWVPSENPAPNVAEVRLIETAIDRSLPRGVTRIRGGIVLDVRFDDGEPMWGARFTCKVRNRVRDFCVSGVYSSPSWALAKLLEQVRTCPKDLF